MPVPAVLDVRRLLSIAPAHESDAQIILMHGLIALHPIWHEADAQICRTGTIQRPTYRRLLRFYAGDVLAVYLGLQIIGSVHLAGCRLPAQPTPRWPIRPKPRAVKRALTRVPVQRPRRSTPYALGMKLSVICRESRHTGENRALTLRRVIRECSTFHAFFLLSKTILTRSGLPALTYAQAGLLTRKYTPITDRPAPHPSPVQPSRPRDIPPAASGDIAVGQPSPIAVASPEANGHELAAANALNRAASPLLKNASADATVAGSPRSKLMLLCERRGIASAQDGGLFISVIVAGSHHSFTTFLHTLCERSEATGIGFSPREARIIFDSCQDIRSAIAFLKR